MAKSRSKPRDDGEKESDSQLKKPKKTRANAEYPIVQVGNISNIPGSVQLAGREESLHQLTMKLNSEKSVFVSWRSGRWIRRWLDEQILLKNARDELIEQLENSGHRRGGFWFLFVIRMAIFLWQRSDYD